MFSIHQIDVTVARAGAKCIVLPLPPTPIMWFLQPLCGRCLGRCFSTVARSHRINFGFTEGMEISVTHNENNRVTFRINVHYESQSWNIRRKIIILYIMSVLINGIELIISYWIFIFGTRHAQMSSNPDFFLWNCVHWDLYAYQHSEIRDK